MRVRMKMVISGSRNGRPWPNVGETIDVPDHEGHNLINLALAERVENAATTQDASPAQATAPAPGVNTAVAVSSSKKEKK